MIANTGFMGKILVVGMLAATLAACGGSSDDAASSASSSGSSTSASASVPVKTIPTGAHIASQELVALSAASYAAAPASTLQVRIDRSGPTSGSASVGYSTVNGTASAGADYEATTGTVNWEDGDTTAKVISVPVMGRAGGKTFAITLVSVAGDAEFGSPASATIEVSAPTAASSSSTSSTSSGGSSPVKSSSGSSTSSSSSSGSSSAAPSSGSSSGKTSSSSSSSSGSSSGGPSGSSSSSSGSAPVASTATASLSWAAPTDNTNGTALTNLAGYIIYYGTSASAMSTKININTVGILDYVVSNLAHGTWYFAITAVNNSGQESTLSGTVVASL